MKLRCRASQISALLILALLSARSFAQKGAHDSNKYDPNKKDIYAELGKAPKKAAARRNPLETDPEAVAGGANLYDQHCAECHGELAEGTRKGPSLRADAVLQATPGTLFWILTNGVVRRGMPVWSKLPEPQRWQLVSYLKSLGAQPKAPQPFCDFRLSPSIKRQ
jgi:mono/diheme cytochrome c family protein